MNHTYRIVFNRALDAWQVVTETARGHGRGRAKLALLAALSVVGVANVAQAAGNVTVSSGADSGTAFDAGGIFAADSTIDSNISTGTLQSQLGSQDVTVIAPGITTFSNAFNYTGASDRTLTVNTGGALSVDAVIGSSTAALSGVLTGATVTFSPGASFNSQGGNLAIAATSGAASLGAVSLGSGNLIASAGGGITLGGDITAGSQTFSNAVRLDGNVTLSATGGAIAFQGPVDGASSLTLNGTATFNAAVGAISALASLNVNGAVQLGGNVTTVGAQTYAGAMTLASDIALNSTGAGSIALTSSVDNATGAARHLVITTAGTVFIGGAVGSINGPIASLRSMGQNFTAGSLNIGDGGLAVSTTGGGISQQGAFTVTGSTTLDANGGAITLTGAGNRFAGAVSLSGGAISLVNMDSLSIAGVTGTHVSLTGAGVTLNGDVASSDLTLTSVGAPIIQAGGTLTVSGMTNIDAGSNAIALNSVNLFTGPVSLTGGTTSITNAGPLDLGTLNTGALTATTLFGALNLGGGTVGGNLVATTGSSSITQASALTVNGTSQINAGAAPISLTNAGNSFSDAVSLNNSGVNNVALNNGGAALTMGSSSIGSGTLTLSGQSIAQTGAIVQEAGAGAVSLIAGAGSIALNNIGNAFTGPVSLHNSGANNVALSNGVNGLTLATSSVGSGTLALSGGAIAQTGAITQAPGAGAVSVNAGASAITLTSAGNDFTGTVNLTGGATQIRDANGLTLGTLNTGALAAMAGGDLAFNGVANNASVTVASLGAISQGAGGVIHTATLTGGSAGDTTLNGANLIGMLGSFSAANFSLTNAQALTVAGPLTTPGGTGNIRLTTTSGALTLSTDLAGGNIDLRSASDLALSTRVTGTTIHLAAGGNISQGAGVLTAGSLTGSSGGTTSLNGANAIAAVGDFSSTGDFSLASTQALTVDGTLSAPNIALVTDKPVVVKGSILGNLQGSIALVFDRSDDAVFAGALGGGSSVSQIGSGTLTLSGANSYAGGTALKTGRLNVGSDTALGSGALSMDDGTTLGFAKDHLTVANAIRFTGTADPTIDTGGFTETLNGAISGGGDLTKVGIGTLILGGANVYTGATTVAQGTLQSGAASALSAASNYTVSTGATLDLAGHSQSVASMNNAGTVSLTGPAPGNTLVVNGPWVGAGGVLKLGTALGDAASVSDKLVLNGPTANASGRTVLRIANVGGLGALTTGNGIEVISATGGATTTARTTKDAFALAGDHVDAGAYQYHLQAGDANGAGENWYLSSATAASTPKTQVSDAGVPTYRSEVPLMAALPEQMRQANLAMLGNLHLRTGDNDIKTDSGNPIGGGAHRAWGRVVSTNLDIRQGGTVDPVSDGRLSGFQAGTDLVAQPNWHAGLYVGQLDGDMAVNGFAQGLRGLGVGSNDLRNQYLGAYGTYSGEAGFYTDVVLQAGRHRYDVNPNANIPASGKAGSLLASLEVGQSFDIGGSGRWQIEPQLQLAHQQLSMDDTALSGATPVQQQTNNGWMARLGVRLKGAIDTRAGKLQPYARLNVYRSTGGSDVALFIGPAAVTPIETRLGSTSTEASAGATLALSEATSLYGEIGRLWASGGDTRVESTLNASVGLRVKW